MLHEWRCCVCSIVSHSVPANLHNSFPNFPYRYAFFHVSLAWVKYSVAFSRRKSRNSYHPKCSEFHKSYSFRKEATRCIISDFSMDKNKRWTLTRFLFFFLSSPRLRIARLATELICAWRNQMCKFETMKTAFVAISLIWSTIPITDSFWKNPLRNDKSLENPQFVKCMIWCMYVLSTCFTMPFLRYRWSCHRFSLHNEMIDIVVIVYCGLRVVHIFLVNVIVRFTIVAVSRFPFYPKNEIVGHVSRSQV